VGDRDEDEDADWTRELMLLMSHVSVDTMAGFPTPGKEEYLLYHTRPTYT
jgi:hypothetical protein